MSINIHKLGIRYLTRSTIYNMECKSKRDLSPSVGDHFIAPVPLILHEIHNIFITPTSDFRANLLRSYKMYTINCYPTPHSINDEPGTINWAPTPHAMNCQRHVTKRSLFQRDI